MLCLGSNQSILCLFVAIRFDGGVLNAIFFDPAHPALSDARAGGPN
jgi:hypothetical protein